MESDQTLFELQYQFHNDIDICIEINRIHYFVDVVYYQYMIR